MRPQIGSAAADQTLDIAVLLLEVLGAEEHALRPNNLTIPGHGFRLLAAPSRRHHTDLGLASPDRHEAAPPDDVQSQLLDLIEICFRKGLPENALHIFAEFFRDLLVKLFVRFPVPRL